MRCEVRLQLLAMFLDERLEWTIVRGLSFICRLYESLSQLIFESMVSWAGDSILYVCCKNLYATVCVQLGFSLVFVKFFCDFVLFLLLKLQFSYFVLWTIYASCYECIVLLVYLLRAGHGVDAFLGTASILADPDSGKPAFSLVIDCCSCHDPITRNR